MTRIIAGAAGGLRLDVPASGTRPTSDRVRESLFAALESQDMLAGARVLDLYAGSGALGLEALSRGAVHVDLVEHNAKAAAVVRRNAEVIARATGATARAHRSTVTAFLRQGASAYDLVFLDPPYDIADEDLTEALALLRPLLTDDALVVVERAKRSAEPEWERADLEQVRERRHGDTALWWAQPRPASQSA
ncbi:16S rRNA (guanine(966)-N(2))-methyltransferase RsmD [Microbacterium binotii]|uniref:16S rRNA (Guanine(966)-N(2))-methyltransferase RsmD n=1 Tax=Microbacterium binotii TaxID=462710 RepID=A0ABN3PEH1_9MICO